MTGGAGRGGGVASSGGGRSHGGRVMKCGTHGRRSGRGRRCAAALAALAVSLAPAAAAAQARVALVIGNGAYSHVSKLPNPPNDAADVGAALERLGFDVTPVIDADVDALLDALEAFRNRSADADVALVFYAGHGIEVAGANYLIPVDAELARARDVAREAVSLDDLLRHTAGARLRLVILDACRNNPFAERMAPTRGFERAMSRGLAPVAVRPSTDAGEVLVALSTAPGEVAEDGPGRNSPFTTGLLQHVEEPGLDVGLLFRRVTSTVLDRTEQRQRPWLSASLLREHYLAGAAADPPAPVAAATELYYGAPRPEPAAPAAAVVGGAVDGGPNAGLKYRILRRSLAGEAVPVAPDTPFRSGDRIRFAFEPNIDGYLYVIQQGTSGRWSPLLPHPQIAGGRNTVVRFGEVTIPPGGWFRFDDTPGIERVFVYLSREPVRDLPGVNGPVIAVQPVDQQTVNDLTSTIGSMDLVFEREDAPAAVGGTGEAVYVVNQAGGMVWSLIELRHQ